MCNLYFFYETYVKCEGATIVAFRFVLFIADLFVERFLVTPFGKRF